MLATQQCDIGRHIWSSNKLGPFHQEPVSPRMSSREQLKTQQDWREQYSHFLPPTESSLLPPHFDQVTDFDGIDASTAERQFVARPQQEHRLSLAQLDSQRDVTQAITIDRPDSAPGDFGQQSSNGLRNASVEPAESTAPLLPSASIDSTSPSVKPRTDTSTGQIEDPNPTDAKEGGEEEDDDDEEMAEPEDGGGQPQTEAERRAERRKMKRFRLTHQQTRFLMSEFAKQAHPDAAHRERLSREIPGLSPRQVQVWFQNRRAKIKRLTADDRDRMLKMRAVPDDFDNVQALHSPYGAVHAIGTPLQSPIDYASSYSEQAMMRPLLIDTIRRHENDEQHLSPTGLSAAFGHPGFVPPGPLSTSDVLSPQPLNSGDRYYGSHQSSPISAGPRSANTLNRQNSSDNYQFQPHPRQPRPPQPLQHREALSRTRSQSLQSPLRSSMSWKGEILDFADYPAGATSRRQQLQYHPDQTGSNPSSHPYDTSQYPNSNIHVSPTDTAYSASQQTPLQSPAATGQSFRSTSSAFPPGLDLRNQYRTLTSQQMGPPSGASPTLHGGAFNSPFVVSSSGFSSAPLSAPSDFQLPRTPIDIGPRDYHIGQLSAPIGPPPDFGNAYGQILSPVRTTHTEGVLHTQQLQQQHATESNIQTQLAETPVFLPTSNDGAQPSHKRKRTFSMSLQFGEQ